MNTNSSIKVIFEFLGDSSIRKCGFITSKIIKRLGILKYLLQNLVIYKKLVRKWYYLTTYLYLASKRAYILCKTKSEYIIYFVWLFGAKGWRSRRTSIFNYMDHLVGGLVRLSIFIYVYFYIKNNFGAYSFYVYNSIEDPIMTDHGYMLYAVLIISSLVVIGQLTLFITSKLYRAAIRPYLGEVIAMNLVVLFIGVSLLCAVDESEIGLRIWYYPEPSRLLFPTGGVDKYGDMFVSVTVRIIDWFGPWVEMIKEKIK